MPSVAIHPPKTPVTKGSHTIAKATIPNVCKMPGPPAPFVPSPLPNIAKSELSPKDYSTTVKIEGKTVAIRGATFESMGDMASKGTGGGLISANCHGPAKFITPGSLTVKIEGKSVHLLGEPMLNNCGASGSPPNTGATMSGADHADQNASEVIVIECNVNSTAKSSWSCCQLQQYCAKIEEVDEQVQRKTFDPEPDNYDQMRRVGNSATVWYRRLWNQAAASGILAAADQNAVRKQFYADCQYEEARANNFHMTAQMGSPDHIQEIQAAGSPANVRNLRWLNGSVNTSVKSVTSTVAKSYDSAKSQSVAADCCPAEATYCGPPKTPASPVIP